jgi:hypothetical protein
VLIELADTSEGDSLRNEFEAAVARVVEEGLVQGRGHCGEHGAGASVVAAARDDPGGPRATKGCFTGTTSRLR